jgi:hypothetical protein
MDDVLVLLRRAQANGGAEVGTRVQAGLQLVSKRNCRVKRACRGRRGLAAAHNGGRQVLRHTVLWGKVRMA